MFSISCVVSFADVDSGRYPDSGEVERLREAENAI